MGAVAVQIPSLWRLGLPLLFNAVLGLFTTLFDALVLSWHSPEAAASVSIANQILTPVYDLSLIVGVGAVVLVAKALGQSDPAKARHLSSVAILANTLFGVLVGGVLWCLAPFLVQMVGTPAALQADTAHYIRLIAWAMPFNACLLAAMACLRAFALGRMVMYLGLLAFPGYALLSVILVLGAGPIPSMGVEGSALATVLIRVLAVVLLFLVLPRKPGLRWPGLQGLVKAREHVLRMVRIASPSVLDNVSYGFYQLLLLGFVAGLGVSAVVSRFYALTLGAFLAVIVVAVSQSNEVIIGHLSGQGRNADVNRQVWRSGGWSVALATVCGGLLWMATPAVLALAKADEAVVATVQHLMLLTVFIQPLTGLNTVLFHSLRVKGDVMVPVLCSQVVMWGMAAPLAWWLSVRLEMGVVGLWYAFLLEEACKTLVMIWRWMVQADDKPAVPALELRHE
ncbi:MAG: MATE family efflux transporter [Pseudomonadota bacterium]